MPPTSRDQDTAPLVYTYFCTVLTALFAVGYRCILSVQYDHIFKCCDVHNLCTLLSDCTMRVLIVCGRHGDLLQPRPSRRHGAQISCLMWRFGCAFGRDSCVCLRYLVDRPHRKGKGGEGGNAVSRFSRCFDWKTKPVGSAGVTVS